MTTIRHRSTPEELRDKLAAERAGVPFLLYRDPTRGQRIFALTDVVEQATIGRGARCSVQLQLDPEISRMHAELRRLGEDWVIADDGLSRNGTFVNEERLVVRRRLLDGDVVRCGSTPVRFHDPRQRGAVSTHAAGERVPPSVSDSQRRVLVALCRPLRDGDPYGLPASNQTIGAELHLSLSGVKGHLRTLFEKLEVDPGLPQNQKRLRLAERAVESGLIKLRELHDDGS